MSAHACGLVLSGCARHWLSGSRLPVHSETAWAPKSGARSTRLAAWRVSSARIVESGWAML